MKREIRFRAWHKKYKKFYEVSNLNMATIMNGGIWATANTRDCIEDKDIKIQIQPKDIEVMQFTGCRDKNRVDIFEGDIVRYIDSFDDIHTFGVIEFQDAAYTINTRNEIYTLHTRYPMCEIIGNIYQHPSLLSNERI